MEKYDIIIGGKTYKPSKYQIEIFKTIESGIGNLIINASAGSSKTTTIVNSIRFISEKKKILFVAFNKDIVEKIRTNITHPNTNVSTFHSLGYNILRENKIFGDDQNFYDQDIYNIYNKDIINIYKYNNYINTSICNITRFGEINSLGKKKSTYIKNIKDLIDYSRYYLALTVKEISKIAEIYGIIAIRDEFEVVRRVLLWGKENLSHIDYTDMIWLPNVLNLTTKKQLYDWIFIDEAQDTSIAEQGLIEKCFKRGTRFVAVGDNFQQINIWAGSTEKAIDLLKKHPNTNEFSLPISYRCPKKIIELAKQYSDNIVASDEAIDGEINYDVSVNEPKNGDMVLCRTTAPLIELSMTYMRNNKKAYIRGNEKIKENFLSLIAYADSKIIDRNCLTADGLFPKLYSLVYEKIDILKNTTSLTDNEILTHQTVISLYDDIESLKVLSEGLITTDELKDKINIIFNGDATDAIQLSTIHKAKGLEADNVFILYPSLLPSKLATKDWEIKTENNLIYVAYTRTKKTLNFIKEDKYSRINGYFNLDRMKNEIYNVKNQIVANKEFGLTEDNYQEITKKPKVITLGCNDDCLQNNININKNIISTPKNKQKGGLKMKNLL